MTIKAAIIQTLVFLWIMPIWGQSINNVKLGYEIDSEGPFPSSTVFQKDHLIIRWDKAGLQGQLAIDVRNLSHTVAYVISPAYPCGDLPKSFTVPTALLPGTYYINVSQGSLSGKSPNFLVKSPRSLSQVQVFLEGQALPAAFHPGQTVAVSWQAQLLGKVKLVLKKSGGAQVMIISSSRPYNDIPATFNIPSGSLGDHVVEVSQGNLKASSPVFKIGLPRLPFRPQRKLGG